MEIVRIFGSASIESSQFWSVLYDNENADEFSRLFSLRANDDYLTAFFKEHISDLQSAFWKNISIGKAVVKAIEEAEIFQEMFYEIVQGRRWGNKNNIKQIFQPLDNRDYYDKIYQKQKAKPGIKLPFLRLYAIRLADDSYIITGGAIKLTEKMNDRKHLKRELIKMEQVKQYLNENGILYFEDLISK